MYVPCLLADVFMCLLVYVLSLGAKSSLIYIRPSSFQYMKPHSKLMQEMYADSFPHPSPWVWDQCTVVKHSLMISYQTSTAYPCNLTDISKMSGRGNSHGIQHFCRRMKAAVLIYCLCCFFRTCNIVLYS